MTEHEYIDIVCPIEELSETLGSTHATWKPWHTIDMPWQAGHPMIKVFLIREKDVEAKQEIFDK